MDSKERIREQQRILMETFTKLSKLNMSVLGAKLSHSEFGTMKCITKCCKQKETRVSDVVKMMRVPPPAVSRTLKTLERKGYVIRTVDTEDRRNTFVECTEEGEKALEETKNMMGEFADTVFQNMGEKSLVQMNEFFTRLLDTAEAELDKRKNEKLEGGKVNE